MSQRSRRQAKTGEQKVRHLRLRAPQADAIWSVPVEVDDIPETGRHFDLIADTVTRAAVAKAVGVVALPQLKAAFDVVPLAKEGLRVAGAVSATAEQTCVITLDPVISQVEEPIDLVFMSSGVTPQDLAIGNEADGGDPPEPLQNGIVDLGALAVEFLLLGIDTYPRKAGASFEVSYAQADSASHPFAALVALKKDSGGKQG